MEEKKEIKKIFHLADIHIRTYRMHETYREAFNNLITQLREIGEDYDREELRIVIVGDIVHQKITISNEQIMLTSKLLSELSMICPVIMVAGNHDLLENNKDRLDSLTPISEFLGDSVTYLTESKCYPDNNIVWCNYSVFEDKARPDIESAKDEHGEDKKYIGLWHAPIDGAKTDKNFEFEGYSDKETFKGCDAVMMGDIHKFQEIKYNGINLVYPGSLVQQNYGESVGNHGFLVWDINSIGKDDTPYEFREVETSYGFFQFRVDSANAVENDEEVLNNE